jgi:hypothetical protein
MAPPPETPVDCICNPDEKIFLIPEITPKRPVQKSTPWGPTGAPTPKPAPTANLGQTRFPFPSRFQIQNRGKNMPCRTVLFQPLRRTRFFFRGGGAPGWWCREFCTLVCENYVRGAGRVWVADLPSGYFSRTVRLEKMQ